MPRTRSKRPTTLLPEATLPPVASYVPSVEPQDAPGRAEDRETHLDAAYPVLIRWKAKLLTPQDPQNPDEFCAAHGISKAELESLTRRPTYADDVLAASIEWSKSRAPEMLHAMYLDGKQTPAGADRFMKALTEIIRRKQDVTTQTQINVFSGMPDDKFARIVTRALKAPDGSQMNGSPE